jgi:hypothetical protein
MFVKTIDARSFVLGLNLEPTVRIALIALLLSTFGVAAAGPSTDGFDFELFRPSADSYGYFAVPSAATLGHLEFRGGAWINYQNDPIVFVSEGVRIAPKNAEVVGDNGEGIVDDRITGNVLIGVGLSRFFSLSVDAPLVLSQDGYLPNQHLVRVDTVPERLAVAGLGDVRVTPKVVALDRDRHSMGMSFAVPVGVPSGTGGSFLGEGGVSATPTAIFEFSDASIRSREYSFRSAVMAGYRLRPPAQIRDVPVGTAVVYGLALGLHASFIELIGEFHGSVWGDGAAQRPAEVLGGVKLFAGDSLSLNLGGGMGVFPGIGAPDWRGFFGLTVAPRLKPGVEKTKPEEKPVEQEAVPAEAASEDVETEPESKCERLRRKGREAAREGDDLRSKSYFQKARRCEAEVAESACDRLKQKSQEAAEAGDREQSRIFYQQYRNCTPPSDW